MGQKISSERIENRVMKSEGGEDASEDSADPPRVTAIHTTDGNGNNDGPRDGIAGTTGGGRLDSPRASNDATAKNNGGRRSRGFKARPGVYLTIDDSLSSEDDEDGNGPVGGPTSSGKTKHHPDHDRGASHSDRNDVPQKAGDSAIGGFVGTVKNEGCDGENPSAGDEQQRDVIDLTMSDDDDGNDAAPRKLVGKEGSGTNSPSGEDERMRAEVDLPMDDDDENNNDVVEMFSKFQGNYVPLTTSRYSLIRYNLRERLGRNMQFRCTSQARDDDSESEECFGEDGRNSGGSAATTPRKKSAREAAETLFDGEHSDECFICCDGGSLVCCDFCDKAFHQECHIPKLSKLPTGTWKCCECRAVTLTRLFKCGECAACSRAECRQCRFCRDMKKFGGKGILKQACVEKRCPNKRYALPATVTPQSTPRQWERETGSRGSDADPIERNSIQSVGESALHVDNAAPTEFDITPTIQDDSQRTVVDQDGESCKGGLQTDKESDANDDECYICSIGGDLVCCDFCEKSFHRKCHIPRLMAVPDGEWKCCECRAVEIKELSSCGECDDCLRPNCGECGPCLDGEILGHANPGACERKRCRFMRYAAPEEGRARPVGPKTARGRPRKASQGAKHARRPRKKRKGTGSKRSRRNNNDNIMESPFESSAAREGGECIILSIKVGSKKKKPNFFDKFFAGRTYEVKVDIDDTSYGKVMELNSRRLELVAGKVPKENAGMFAVKEMKLMYIATEGDGLPKIDLQKELDRICSFSSIPHVKVGARLSVGQSEARQIIYTSASKIELIEENGNEGCGFFPRGFFDGGIRGKGYDSIQVRIIGPKIGLGKGMLLARDEISKVQLPESMIKAPPSTTSDEDWVAIVVKNVFPCAKNVQLGRQLDPYLEACASWKKDKQKELSKMHQRMLIGYGVKREDVEAYAKRSTYSENLKHAHLKGVADPTMKIPEDKVFVSGYVTNGNGERVLFGNCYTQIYVSRSPAVSPDDAKILTILGEKTDDMSDNEWDLLCSYGWGTIVFGAPRHSPDPLPRIIADGDLDGDDYFVCWDPHVLSQLLHSKDELASRSRKLLLELKMPDKVKQGVDKSISFARGGGDWLSAAQDLILDFSTQKAESDIVGKLYGLCKKASKKTGGKIDIYDEDACAYASAYKDAIDIQKHGGTVFLPKHLHKSIPPSLRDLLV